MKKVTKGILIIVFGGIILLLIILFSFSFGFYKSPYAQNVNDYLASLSKNILNIEQDKAPLGLPMRLTIPSIGVDANILEVGLAADGSVDVPKGPHDVAWFNRGPQPGQPGSSVIVGHAGKWQNGLNSVFDNLNKLKKGDTIYVKNDKGFVTSFVVRETKTYNPEDVVPDIFKKNDGTYLNLITCSGAWISEKKTYNKRLVVFTDLTLP